MIRFSVLILLQCIWAQTLTFQNEDVLSGAPNSLGEGILSWEATNLSSEVKLPVSALKEIAYPEKKAIQGQALQMQVMMYRGDSYTGQITRITDSEIGLSTDWAGDLLINRKYVSQIRPLIQKTNLLGNITDLAMWNGIAHRGKWTPVEGGIVANGRAAMSRELDVPESFHFSCELKILSSPRIKFLFFASEGDIYEPNEYLEISLQRGSVSARTKVKGNVEALGQNTPVSDFQQGRVHQVDFYCSLLDQSIVFYLDGKKMTQWVLPENMNTNPWLYFHGDCDGEVLLKKPVIEKWNRILPYDSDAIAQILDKDNKTLLHLINGDAIDASKISYQESGLKAETEMGNVDIPLNRIGFIDFSGLPYQEAKRERGDVKLTLLNGDVVTLNLAEWKDQSLVGANQNFSQINVKENAIQKVEFNIYR